MRVAVVLMLLIGRYLLAAEDPEQRPVLAAVQRLFDAMSAHDSAGAAAVLIADGRVVSIRADGQVNDSSQGDFAANLAKVKQKYLERMWNPKVFIRGGIAHVWAEYDFHLDGKFHHCGVDSFSLAKTADGWKIAGITYTVETAGCAPSPLDPPPA